MAEFIFEISIDIRKFFFCKSFETDQANGPSKFRFFPTSVRHGSVYKLG